MFAHLAVLSFAGTNDDEVLEALLEAEVDVEEVEEKDGQLTIFAPASEFYKAKTAVLGSFPGTELDVQEITFLAQGNVDISGEDVVMFEKMLSMLNDCEDVQDVYHNAQLPSD